MKIVVAVVVFNRFRNIEEWIRCWKQCNTTSAELVIIHNFKNPQDMRMYESFCKAKGVGYISRPNIGFDIGALQDVSNKRLPGFPEYDYLLWCTDDIWPQRKGFIQEYIAGFTNGVAAVAYEISKEVNPHIRTTGFMLHRSTVERLNFNVDPIITKAQCYDFEHRDKINSLMDQVKKIGKAVQPWDIESAPMWDTGHNSREAMRRRLRRQLEHTKTFG